MPRNEFMNHEHSEDTGKNPPEEEEAIQEVEPVEVDPHRWPQATEALLRKSDQSATEAHIARDRMNKEFREKWDDPDHFWEL